MQQLRERHLVGATAAPRTGECCARVARLDVARVAVRRRSVERATLEDAYLDALLRALRLQPAAVMSAARCPVLRDAAVARLARWLSTSRALLRLVGSPTFSSARDGLAT
mgnify:CR=1 FL=1